MLGKPIYKENDIVKFNLTLSEDSIIECVGKVYIVDAYGTFEQNEEPSYDIMVDKWLDTNEPCLVKHIRESQLV